MSPWKVILATMVIFVCGVVTGALVIKTQGWHPPASFAQSGGPFGAPGPGPVWDIVRRMDQAHLNLTTNQHEKIVKIMQDSQATNTAIRARLAPQLQTEKDRAQKAISLLLTPEQQDKFAELLKKPEPRPDGRGRRGGESSGFPMRNPNRFPTNGFPEDGRGRTGRRGPGATNPPPAENPAPTNSATTTPVGRDSVEPQLDLPVQGRTVTPLTAVPIPNHHLGRARLRRAPTRSPLRAAPLLANLQFAIANSKSRPPLEPLLPQVSSLLPPPSPT